MPEYQLITAWRTRLTEEIPQEEDAYFEGMTTTVVINRYERNKRARSKCISHYGCTCQACGTKLSNIYGHEAENYIHVHHTTKISSIGKEYQLDPIADLVPLCPNCHAIAHLRSDPYTVEEIKAMIAKNLKTCASH